MSKIPLQQTAFNRGELDPGLYGRSDWQAYFSGAERIRNMICRPQGGVVKRGGTELICAALDQNSPSVFVRFQYSVDQVYLLEFSDRRFRVLKDGGVVLFPTGHERAGEEVIIESPYSANQIRSMRWAQKHDVLVLTHNEHQPRTLTRYDHHVWKFEALSIGASISPPASLTLTKDGKNGAKYVVASIAANNEESIPGDVVSCGKATGTAIVPPNVSAMRYDECYAYIKTYLGAVPLKYDYWQEGKNLDRTKIDDINGLGPELYQLGVLKKPWVTGSYGNWTQTYWLNFSNGYSPSESWNTEYSWGQSRYDEIVQKYFLPWIREQVDANIAGILNKIRQYILDEVNRRNETATATGFSKLSWPATKGAIRYRVYRSRQTDSGVKYHPIGETAAITFDDDNRAFTSVETPQVSANPFDGPGNYPGVCMFFQQRLIMARTDNKPNSVWGSRIGAFRNFNRQDPDDNGSIADTSAFEFALDSDQGNPIDWGVPMNDLLFGTAGGDFRMGASGVITPTNVNATRQSNYGTDPIMPIVVGRAVVAVGRMGRGLRAYRWDYSGDAYEGKSISHYAGHLFRRRRIASLAFQYEPDSIIWTVMSDGALLSLTYMGEEDVLGWSRNDTNGRFEAVVNMLSNGEDEIWLLVAREINGQTKRFIERMKQPQEDGDDIRNAWYVDCGLAYDGMPRDTFSGLGHLEGENVVCLGDGNVFNEIKVENGVVTLPETVSRAVIGLPFSAELKTMALEPMGGGTISPNARRPAMASVLFYHSRECFYGEPGRPIEMRFHTDSQERPIQPKTIRKNVSVPAPRGSSEDGLWLSSPSPVPFGVLSVSVEMSAGMATPGPGRRLNGDV